MIRPLALVALSSGPSWRNRLLRWPLPLAGATTARKDRSSSAAAWRPRRCADDDGGTYDVARARGALRVEQPPTSRRMHAWGGVVGRGASADRTTQRSCGHRSC
eukprot:scaffold7560_cov390-Prasinococcus_capsulatus_cf.AAC.6